MNNYDESVNALNNIYHAATMGIKSLEMLVKKTDNSDFKNKLSIYLFKYNEIKNKITFLLSNKGEAPEDAKATEKASLWMGVQMNTLINKKPSHMAEMLIKGCTMGIIEVVKVKNLNPNMDAECLKIADEFLVLQQTHIDDMKQYLR